MRIPNIYTSVDLNEEAELTLDDNAAQHLVKVLRMKPGDHVQLFNGSGLFFPAELVQTTRKNAVAKTAHAIASVCESRLHTHIGQVMSRGDRMDYAIQKSTELGVSEITPLTSERCELKLSSERQEKRIRHWQQVAISAAEQCGRATIPMIHPVTDIPQWLDANQHKGMGLIMHHRNTRQLSDIQSRPDKVNLLIGPEGGLSDAEIMLATSAGFTATCFGPRVMRTETAPVSGLSILQWLWGDFQAVTEP